MFAPEVRAPRVWVPLLAGAVCMVTAALHASGSATAERQGPLPARQAAVGGSSLPDAPAAETVRARCLSCHEADLITQQRLSRAGWDREVAKMERWGATVPPAERQPLVDYLAAGFGPRRLPAGSEGTGARSDGEAILQRACLGCHERDLIESQRLSTAGWTRELEKMMRWGAVLSDGEKRVLADDLAARFGPR